MCAIINKLLRREVLNREKLSTDSKKIIKKDLTKGFGDDIIEEFKSSG